MTTYLYTHDDCLEHETPPGHPEQVARLVAINRALSAPGFDAVTRLHAPMGADASVLLAHPASHLTAIKAASPAEGFRSLDADTHMSPGSLQAAFRGVGANVAAVDAVMSGAATNAFVATRPPGHHAEKTTPMGFCLFGNVAIAAKHAMAKHGLSRVSIVDFDVHHGNGTQDLVWDDAGIQFISSHQMPLYPGTGAASETGAHGNVINLPLDTGTNSQTFRRIYEAEVFPAIRAFNPEMILISAGFDAHRDDPLAGLNLVEDDFAWVTRQICTIAGEVCDGRVVSTLEGGYDLDALAASAAVHLSCLMEFGQ